jgi:hypothetical protein
LPVVADGLVNVDVLPMLLSPETQAKLDQLMWNEKRLPTGVVEYEPSGLNDNGEVVLLHLSRLPVINRKMVKASSAKALFLLKYEQLKAQAAQKVWNHLVKAKFPKVSQGLVEQYGLEAANWLESQGIKDYGFSPKTVQGEASDVYIAKEIKVSLKGLRRFQPAIKRFMVNDAVQVRAVKHVGQVIAWFKFADHLDKARAPLRVL